MITGQVWQVIFQIAVILLALLAGGASVDLIKWLKNKFNTSGDWTLVLVAIVAIVLTVATMIVEAAITPGSITLDNFGVVVVAVFAASQARYRMLKDQID